MTEKLKILPTPKGWWKNGENCFVEEKICGDFEGARAAFCEDAKRCGFDFSDGEGGIYVEKDAAMERDEYKLCIKDFPPAARRARITALQRFCSL